MSGLCPPIITAQLKRLCGTFAQLPKKHHPAGSFYLFKDYAGDDKWFEHTGSLQGLLNHTMEVAFGSRHNGAPIEFKSHGPNLIAIVNVLLTHITGLDGENPILIKWISDLQRAADHALKNDPQPLEEPSKRERIPSAKQEIINQEASAKVSKKKKKVANKARAEKAKEQTKEDFLWDPLDLRPAKRNDSTRGRPSDPLLDKLSWM